MTKKDKIELIRDVVQTRQAAVLENILVDLTSAQMIIQVYDHLNDMNKATMRKMSIKKIGEISFKLFNKYGKIG